MYCTPHGGVLLQHLKEHRLQTNINSGDRIFYFTTCGWMMWNWLISVLHLVQQFCCLMVLLYPDGHVL